MCLCQARCFCLSTTIKSHNMQDGVGKPTVRYPDSVKSGLLMVYLLIIRPMEVHLVGAVAEASGEGDGEAASVASAHWDNLFASQRRITSADHLR